MMRQTKISPKKQKEVEFLAKNIEEYNVVGLVSMEKIGAKAVQQLRKALRGKVVMRMAKKRLMKRALSQSKKKNIELLGEEITGSTAMVFTNMNPIKLSKFLEDRAAKAPAKPGDIAPIDITVKAGNTRIAPGPIISELNTVLKLPTMIKDGMIHVRNDTVTHKVGDKIDLKQSILLGRLGLEPMTVTLDFYSAWEDGEIIPEEVLKLDEEKIINDVQVAHSAAFNLAMSLGILSSETLVPMVSKAASEATALAIALEIMSPDTIPMFLSRAAAAANSINKMVYGGDEEEEEVSSDDDKKEEDEQDDDEVMGAGIGALFG